MQSDSFVSAGGFAKSLKSLALQNFNSRDLYISLCAIYLLPNALAIILFCFPLIKRQLEMSNWRIVRFSLWWSQVIEFLGTLSDCCATDYTLYLFNLISVFLPSNF